jgi:hypothetical protein
MHRALGELARGGTTAHGPGVGQHLDVLGVEGAPGVEVARIDRRQIPVDERA